MTMRIFLIGGGGREHALGRKIISDSPATDLHCAPGNPGLAELGTCHDVAVEDLNGLVALAAALQPDLVLIGPEGPLTKGIVNALDAISIPAFGPDQVTAQLEASKSFAKEVMVESGVPTARFQRFDDSRQASAALANWPETLVVKADGLAAGKGVFVCDTKEEAQAGIEACADLNQPVLIEERFSGPEISLFALVKGTVVVPLTTAQDHKRVGENDMGPNTGGMGAYSPGILPENLTIDHLIDLTIRPIAETLVARGTPFCGVLFAGLMLTADGPKVLEYNVRFGDPECQVLMARLKSPLIPLIRALMKDLNPKVEWHDQAAMAVVLAAKGYPSAYAKGDVINLPAQIPDQSHLIHAGTQQKGDKLLTAGGRVMNAVGYGATLHEARDKAYTLTDQIHWNGQFFRRDIGWQVI